MTFVTIQFNNKNNLLFVLENTNVIKTISTDCNTDENNSNEVSRLLNSHNAQDIDHVNSLVTNIIRAKNLCIFKYLLSHGYNIGLLNDKNQTALHLIFYNDWYETENQEINDLLTNYISEVNYTDINGLNHLHIASAIGNLEMVTYYLDTNEDINAFYITDVKESEFDCSGFTPLHFAVFNSRLEIVNLLLESGANVNATDSLGRTPLHLAACNNAHSEFEGSNNLEIFKVLIKNQSNLNAKDNNGNTPLINIYYKTAKEPSVFLGENYTADQVQRQKEKFKVLMGFSPDVKISNNNGDTIVHCIINDMNRLRCPLQLSKISFDDREHLKMVKQLHTFDETIDINAKNNQGETPLQLAVAYMSTEIVKFLLEHNVDLSSLKLDVNFFRYHRIVPDMEVIVHVLGVVDNLESKGFQLTMEDNLTVLKFLVHEYEDCGCLDDSPDNDNIIFKIINLLKSGSATHIKLILKKLEDELSQIDNTLITRYDHRLLYIAFYKKYIKCADFYIDKGVEEAINHLLLVNNVNQDGSVSKKLKSEINCMKSTLLNDNLNVYDVTTQHPYKIYQYVFGEKFDYKFYNLDNFPGYGTFISGHFAKSLVRHYVEKVVDTYFKTLFPLLPSQLYKMIINYLNNKDILNVAIAAVTGDA